MIFKMSLSYKMKTIQGRGCQYFVDSSHFVWTIILRANSIIDRWALVSCLHFRESYSTPMWGNVMCYTCLQRRTLVSRAIHLLSFTSTKQMQNVPNQYNFRVLIWRWVEGNWAKATKRYISWMVNYKFPYYLLEGIKENSALHYWRDVVWKIVYACKVSSGTGHSQKRIVD